jgi:RNA polymerase-interacting CarD/CdnL/TRCF family regulator
MIGDLLKSGDRVFHPVYGVGIVEGLATRDQAGQATDYYTVRLSHGSVLSVPVTCADNLGLRPIANSLATIVACLNSPAGPLPTDDRQRATEIKTRSRIPQPAALSQTVRDLVNHSHAHKLTPADKNWLSAACEHLGDEAAWVDAIDPSEAHAAIQHEIDQLKPN